MDSLQTSLFKFKAASSPNTPLDFACIPQFTFFFPTHFTLLSKTCASAAVYSSLHLACQISNSVSYSTVLYHTIQYTNLLPSSYSQPQVKPDSLILII